MSNLEYYLLWLAGGLVLVAAVSAIITQRLRRSLMRRLKAVELLDALSRYSEWIAAQRRNLLFQGDVQEDASAVAEMRAIVQQWFPDLAAAAAQFFAVHARLVGFLSSQQALRLQDPEAWLESDHDVRFLEQWRELDAALERMAQELRALWDIAPAGPEPRRTSAA
ncbi:MAG: hypothetical protein JWP43_2623 [Ramlibacter sp.]|nr:hypothetical protein [Ramlibacter sp.]